MGLEALIHERLERRDVCLVKDGAGGLGSWVSLRENILVLIGFFRC